MIDLQGDDEINTNNINEKDVFEKKIMKNEPKESVRNKENLNNK